MKKILRNQEKRQVDTNMTNPSLAPRSWKRKSLIENQTVRYSICAGVILYLFLSIELDAFNVFLCNYWLGITLVVYTLVNF